MAVHKDTLYLCELVKPGMGTDFEKKNSNLCGDTADFTPPPPYLVQDFMQSPVIDMCLSKVLHWLPKNSASNSHS